MRFNTLENSKKKTPQSSTLLDNNALEVERNEWSMERAERSDDRSRVCSLSLGIDWRSFEQSDYYAMLCKHRWKNMDNASRQRTLRYSLLMLAIVEAGQPGWMG